MAIINLGADFRAAPPREPRLWISSSQASFAPFGLTMSAIDSILFPEGRVLPAISVCDHYAGSEKLILKSLEIQDKLAGTFDITCDLEDGAAIGGEAALRARVCEIVSSSLNTHRKVGIRFHDFDSPHFGPDLNEVMASVGDVVSHVTVPKITGFAQAKEIVAAIHRSVLDHRIERPVPIHLLIETHGGVHDVWEIAALPGIRGLDFGLMDFVSSHYGALDDGCMHSPEQFENPIVVRAKAKLVAACLAHGVIPVHNVTPDFTAPEKTFHDALTARKSFGFLRMWSIHPNQISQILAAFTPNPGEVTKASEIILAAYRAEWAPIRHNDRLHDRASFRYYWSVLLRAQQAGVELPPEVAELTSART
jgi:citrate lyase subunit beta/citryl-CoA lyase